MTNNKYIKSIIAKISITTYIVSLKIYDELTNTSVMEKNKFVILPNMHECLSPTANIYIIDKQAGMK